MSGSGFGAKVAGGAAWSYAAHAIGRAAVLAGLAATAHVLTPREFGVFAMAMVAVNLLDVVKDFGLRPALVYLLGTDESWDVVDTAFVASLAMGAALAALMLALAGPTGAFYGDATVADLMQLLSVCFVAGSVHAVPDALLRHRLDFRRRFWPEVAAPLARYGVAIGLALAGYGAWSLAIGQVAGAVVPATLAVALVGWRPAWRFRPGVALKLVRFGGQLSVVDVLAALLYNLDYLLVGAFLGSTALGVYTVAYKLPEAALAGTAYVFSTVLLPAYVGLGDDRAQLRAAFVRAFHALGLLLVPAAVGLAVLAPVLVPALFGEQWAAAAPVVQLLAVASLLHAMVFTAGSVLVALGRPRAVILAQLASAAVLLPSLYLAAQASILAVGAVHILGAVVFGGAKLALVCRALALDWRDLAKVATPTVAAASVMGAALEAVRVLGSDRDDLAVAAVGVATAVVVYGAAISVLEASTVRQLTRAIVAGRGAPARHGAGAPAPSDHPPAARPEPSVAGRGR